MSSQKKWGDKTMESRKRKRSRGLITSQDVIFEILRRIPAKSLIRFKLTCKYWNTFISEDPQFEELHSKTWIQKLRFVFQTKSSSDHSMFEPWSTLDFWICKPKVNKTEMKKLQSLPFKSVDGRRHQIDSLGSLLLFNAEGDKAKVPKYSVCDCTNANQIVLPNLPSDVNSVWSEFLVYDASTNLHKVLFYPKDPNSVLHSDFCYITSFNTKTLERENEWRMIGSPFAELKLRLRKATIRDILYMLASAVKDNSTIFIQPFDIAEEKFLNTISFSGEKLSSGLSILAPHLLEFRESLGFMLTTFFEFQIWVLKDSRNNHWIQPFDIAEEKFLNTISFSGEKLSSGLSILAPHLLEFRESLGFMLTTFFEFQIWVLKDSRNNHWIQHHKISLQSMFDSPIPRTLGIWLTVSLWPVFVLENLKGLPSILLRFGNKFFWFEMNGDKVKKIDVDILPAYGRCLAAWFS